MSGEPLVSAVIIFLDEERFIQEAIESVLAQTYENWELLLVDDGSTDGSTQNALRYAQLYPEKVRYLEHPGHQNRGASASRNLGFGYARGEYVGFLDADDVWLPRKLERQVRMLNSCPEAGMVYGSSQYWHSWTGEPEDDQRDFVVEPGVQINTLFEPPALLVLTLREKVPTPPPSDFLLRRRTIERTGGFEESWRGIYQMYEDQAFLAKVYLKEPVFVVSECWDKYRLHPDSCCAVVQRAGKQHFVHLFFLNWLERYLSEQGNKNPEVWKLIQKDQRHVRVRVHVREHEWKQAMRAILVLLRYDPQGFAFGFQKLVRRVYRKLATRAHGRHWTRFS